MKRVLVIAYLFPPILNSGTQRPLKFVKYLRQSGWEPIVLTAERVGDWPLDPHLIEEIPAGVRVVRVPLLNDRIGDLIGTIGITATNRRRISEAVSWRLREWRSDPDLFTLWQPTAVRAAMSIFHETGFDAILATGYPWTSLLVGRDLSKKTGCPFVADFRDPWAAEDLFGGPPRRGALSLERTVLGQASAVVAVSDRLRHMLTDAHKTVSSDKFFTLPNGFDAEDLRVQPAASSSRFRIVYAGVWKPGYGLDDLYAAVAALAEENPQLHTSLEVVAAGFEPGAAAARGLSNLVTELGVVSHRDAVALMRSADALYLPNGAGDRQSWCLPGKLFEYLGCERPILAVTDGNGEAAKLITRVGGGVVIDPSDALGLISVLRSAYMHGRLAVPAIDHQELARYERRAITQRLGTLLDSLKAA